MEFARHFSQAEAAQQLPANRQLALVQPSARDLIFLDCITSTFSLCETLSLSFSFEKRTLFSTDFTEGF
jgi:hypothetical protein